MKIGIMELLVVFVVALLVLGPDKLPEYVKKLGVAMREFRKASSEITKDIQQTVVEPLDEMRKPLADAVAPINEVSQQIERDVSELTDSIKGVKKPAAAAAEPAESAESTVPAEPTAAAPSPAPVTQSQELGENQHEN